MGNLESCCAYGSSSSSSRRESKSSNRQGDKRKQRRNGNNYYSSSGGGANYTGGGAGDAYGSLPDEGGHPGHLHSDGSTSNYLTPGGTGPPRHEESVGNLQHISEREPDDWEEDPSLHPTTETLFMEKSKQSIQSKEEAVTHYNLI